MPSPDANAEIGQDLGKELDEAVLLNRTRKSVKDQRGENRQQRQPGSFFGFLIHIG